MSRLRELLNRLKWSEDALEHAVIWYIHRGGPDDLATVSGGDILDIGRSFLLIRREGGTVSIPHHRVVRVEVEGKAVYSGSDQ